MLLRIYTIWEMNVFIYSKWGPNLLNWWIIPFKIKNLQIKIYLAFFSDFEYLAPLQSYKIFIRVGSEKTYCTEKLGTKVILISRDWSKLNQV